MTDNDTNPYLQAETFQQEVKSGLRAWSEHLARKRAAEAEAEAASVEPEPEPEPAEDEDEGAALFRLLGRD